MRKPSVSRLLTISAAAILLAVTGGCESMQKKNRTAFDGLYFRAKAAPVDKKITLADFTVAVRDVSQSLDAARRAGGHEGIRYCIANYGSSKIVWSVGPQTPPEQLTIDNDTITFRGRCDP